MTNLNLRNSLIYCLIFFAFSCQSVVQTEQHGIVLDSVEEAFDFYTWSEDRIPLVSAHRGGPYPGYPENAIETFENVIQNTPAIIEFDVAITKDSVLVLMHDNTLDRTTTGSGRVADHDFSELKELYLVDKEGNTTPFRIPTLEDALIWANGNALLTVDVKREVPFAMVVEEIEAQNAVPFAAVITYNLDDAKFVYNLNPDLMLSVTIRNGEELEKFEASGIPIKNAIAFTGTSERPRDFNQLLHQKGIFTILGVLGNLDKSAQARGDQLYQTLVNDGADILASDRPIEAAKAIHNLIPENSTKSKYFK